jgi:hypothetical protein
MLGGGWDRLEEVVMGGVYRCLKERWRQRGVWRCDSSRIRGLGTWRRSAF